MHSVCCKALPSFCCVLLALLVTGCDSAGPAKETSGASSPIVCVCTTGMVADLVRHVGGPWVAVEQLMGEGVDPHLYKVSTGDIARLSHAGIIFYSGLHLEGKMADVFARMAERRPTVAVTDAIARSRLLEFSPGTHDPHVWFDVALWSEAIGAVEAALAKQDPAHAEDYRHRAKAYRDELLALDQDCRERLASIPVERRVLVTAHDAFSYFGRAYQLEVRAIQGISTESEAGVREINELVAFIVERGIKAVFVESSVSSRNIQALVEGCEAAGHRVVIGGELYSDAMGQAGTPEGTYVGMVRHNVESIVKALK
jgi:manganese/zinc/iron transport system substrate-binding protein